MAKKGRGVKGKRPPRVRRPQIVHGIRLPPHIRAGVFEGRTSLACGVCYQTFDPPPESDEHGKMLTTYWLMRHLHDGSRGSAS